MTKHSGRPAREPCCPWWVPLSIFTIVLIVIVYLVRSGLDLPAAVVLIATVCGLTVEIARRMATALRPRRGW